MMLNHDKGNDLYPLTPVSNANQKKYEKENQCPRAVSESIHHLKDVYSTALGGYREWSNQVDLGPPKSKAKPVQVSKFLD